jgi:hypothetical protein
MYLSICILFGHVRIAGNNDHCAGVICFVAAMRSDTAWQ